MRQPDVDPIENLDQIDDATALGLPILAQIVEGAADGIFLCDAERRWVYVNDAAAQMLGQPVEDLIGRDYVEVVPSREQAAARQYYAALLAGSTEMLTRMLTTSSGEERETVFAPVRIDIDGRPHGAAFFRDFTATRAAGRTAAVLAQSAADLVGGTPTDEILANTARHAVEGTRALAAGLAVVSDSGGFSSAGSYGPDGATDFGQTSEAHKLQTTPAARFIDAMTAGTMRIGDTPSRAVTLARRAWERDPILSSYGRAVLEQDWESAVTVPLAYDNQVIGALMILLPAGVSALSDAEATFCTALADHAAVAVANERLAGEAARSAELRERSRVARELHDSVSQALFAMTMHARAADLAMTGAGLGGDTALARSLAQLSQLSRGTLAEMRTLIFELRPEALIDEGLLTALSTRAAALASREQVRISVDGPPDRLPLTATAEAGLYKITSTALLGVVRRAGSGGVAVRVDRDDRVVTVTIDADRASTDPTDDRHAGRGHDHAGRDDTALTEQARAVGAALEIDRDGTRVVITLPMEPPSSDEAGEP